MSQTTHSDARQRAILCHLPLVKQLAGRIARGLPRFVDLEDLIQAGTVGLIQAYENYDPGRGVEFETYAARRIRGAILDELRKGDFLPRRQRQEIKALDRARRHLGNGHGRAPSDGELADEADIPLAKVQELAGDEVGSRLRSLEEFIDCDTFDNPRTIGEMVTYPEATDALERLATHDAGAKAQNVLCTLPYLMQLVVRRHDEQGQTLISIGASLGLSEPRISQIRTEALQLLRSRLRHLRSIPALYDTPAYT